MTCVDVSITLNAHVNTGADTYQAPTVEHQEEAADEAGVRPPARGPRRIVVVGVARVVGDGQRREGVAPVGWCWTIGHGAFALFDVAVGGRAVLRFGADAVVADARLGE